MRKCFDIPKLFTNKKKNELMSKKHNKVCRTLNYFDYFLVFVSAVSGCVPISMFTSLVGVAVSIESSAVGFDTCASTAGMKNYKSINKKRGKSIII